MSSGTLPGATYHRASHLGAGTFGSVVVVYNNDGEEYALKLFKNDHESDCKSGSDSDSEFSLQNPIALGALREISCLRLLRGDNQHTNIVSLVDVQADWSTSSSSSSATATGSANGNYDEADGCGGAGTSGCLSMALPLGKYGSLASAIEKNLFLGCPQSVKVRLAHGLLSAVLYLHDNGILHRDIKCDNILLERDDGYGNDRDSDGWKPILIDFSLAKPVDGTMWNQKKASDLNSNLESILHTGDVGTLIYTAPEVVAQEGYGKPADLYSVGVVLLELVQGRLFTAEKAKEATAQITTSVASLPKATPFASLIRSLLTIDQDERITANDACKHPVFQKFDLLKFAPKRHIVDLSIALPYDNSDSDAENECPNHTSLSAGKRENDERDALDRRLKSIDKILREIDSEHPWTRWAALEYSIQLEQLDDDVDDNKYSQTLADCCVLAHRFWELDLVDLSDLDARTTGPFSHWSIDEYIDTEATIFMLLDYCLYPRNLSFRKA